MLPFGLARQSDIGNDVAGDRELAILEPVNQAGDDVRSIGPRNSKPDSMLLAYKG